jgi:hypothetical protein
MISLYPQAPLIVPVQFTPPDSSIGGAVEWMLTPSTLPFNLTQVSPHVPLPEKAGNLCRISAQSETYAVVMDAHSSLLTP